MDFVGDEDAVRYAIQHALGENTVEWEGLGIGVVFPSARVARDFLAELQRRGFEVKKIDRGVGTMTEARVAEDTMTEEQVAEELLAGMLRPCPFCGGSKFGFDVSNCGEKQSHVECLGCGARGPGVGRSEVEGGDWNAADAEAVRRWNEGRPA